MWQLLTEELASTEPLQQANHSQNTAVRKGAK